jgi:hypothetical protein
MVYLDESGISTNETITVVAGVIIDADKQWKAVSQYIDSLIEEYVPKEHRDGFVFHAKHLFHGSQIFDPSKYPPERRREVLKKLVEIPAKFYLPTVYGYSDKWWFRAAHERCPSRHRHRVSAVHHAVTYAFCAIAVERFMREHARPEEIATLIAENNEDARKAVKTIHHHLRGKALNAKEATATFLRILRENGAGDYLPIRKIIDCVHFALKDEAILLQIADACAFTYRCYLENKPNTTELSEALMRNNLKALEPNKSEHGSVQGCSILYFAPPA